MTISTVLVEALLVKTFLLLFLRSIYLNFGLSKIYCMKDTIYKHIVTYNVYPNVLF